MKTQEINTIYVSNKAEYESAIKAPGENKIEMSFFDDLSDGDHINIRYESGYEIRLNGQIIGACSSSAPVYCKSKNGTLDNRALYNYA